MVIRVALCMVLFAAACPAQWKRYAETYERGGIDSPLAHDLQYFRVHPCSRSDKKDRFTYCEEPPSEAETPTAGSDPHEPPIVGKIGDFTIYDLEYFLGFDYPGPHMRSTLVETPGHQFHEIYMQESLSGGTLFPTEILKAGQQPVIKLKYDDGGMYHIVIESYFVILDGVRGAADFGPVDSRCRGSRSRRHEDVSTRVGSSTSHPWYTPSGPNGWMRTSAPKSRVARARSRAIPDREGAGS